MVKTSKSEVESTVNSTAVQAILLASLLKSGQSQKLRQKLVEAMKFDAFAVSSLAMPVL